FGRSRRESMEVTPLTPEAAARLEQMRRESQLHIQDVREESWAQRTTFPTAHSRPRLSPQRPVEAAKPQERQEMARPPDIPLAVKTQHAQGPVSPRYSPGD